MLAGIQIGLFVCVVLWGKAINQSVYCGMCAIVEKAINQRDISFGFSVNYYDETINLPQFCWLHYTIALFNCGTMLDNEYLWHYKDEYIYPFNWGVQCMRTLAQISYHPSL